MNSWLTLYLAGLILEIVAFVIFYLYSNILLQEYKHLLREQGKTDKVEKLEAMILISYALFVGGLLMTGVAMSWNVWIK